jgi:Zn ribbon nucleic-acid-binding protein
MKYWEIIVDNFTRAGWSWGCVSAIDSNEPTVWMQTHIETTENVSCGVRMRSWRRLLDWNRRYGSA